MLKFFFFVHKKNKKNNVVSYKVSYKEVILTVMITTADSFHLQMNTVN